MNRAERRRAKRNSEKLEHTFKTTNEHELRKIREIARVQLLDEANDIRAEGMRIAVIEMVSAFVLALKESEGFGKTRIDRVLKITGGIFDKIGSGELTKTEVEKRVKKMDLEYKIFDSEKE